MNILREISQCISNPPFSRIEENKEAIQVALILRTATVPFDELLEHVIPQFENRLQVMLEHVNLRLTPDNLLKQETLTQHITIFFLLRKPHLMLLLNRGHLNHV